MKGKAKLRTSKQEALDELERVTKLNNLVEDPSFFEEELMELDIPKAISTKVRKSGFNNRKKTIRFKPVRKKSDDRIIKTKKVKNESKKSKDSGPDHYDSIFVPVDDFTI